MKTGIWREDEGFHVMVDGVDRVYSDDFDGALELANNLKRNNRRSRIEIRTARCARCWRMAGSDEEEGVYLLRRSRPGGLDRRNRNIAVLKGLNPNPAPGAVGSLRGTAWWHFERS
jgi:hypothetical protein